MNATMQLIACSGPGAGGTIANSVAIGYASAGLTAVLVVEILLLSRRHVLPRFPVIAAVILLLLHPAWTISAAKGDCGQMKRLASYTVLPTVLLISTAMKRRIKRSKEAED